MISNIVIRHVSKDRTNVQLHKKFTKCDDQYLEESEQRERERERERERAVICSEMTCFNC